jgi:hypothetical protein
MYTIMKPIKQIVLKCNWIFAHYFITKNTRLSPVTGSYSKTGCKEDEHWQESRNMEMSGDEEVGIDSDRE